MSVLSPVMNADLAKVATNKSQSRAKVRNIDGTMSSKSGKIMKLN
jgi:hypothetical protein